MDGRSGDGGPSRLKWSFGAWVLVIIILLSAIYVTYSIAGK